jgi:hypothetical protein
MKRWLVLAVTVTIGCDVSVDPIDVPPLHGSYRLTMIDGVALPHSVKLDGEPTPVTDGILELTFPNLVAISLTLGEPGKSDPRSIAVAGTYRRVTPDSLVMPSMAPPELFVRRSGATVVLVTESRGGVGPAQLLGGSHRFTFVEQE